MIKSLKDLNKEELKALEKKLQKELSTVDRELTDLMHYIEFNDITTLESMDILTMLKEVRSDRRSIKNKLELIKSCKTSLSKNKVSNLTKLIKKQQKPIYHVRELKQFGEVITY